MLMLELRLDLSLYCDEGCLWEEGRGKVVEVEVGTLRIRLDDYPSPSSVDVLLPRRRRPSPHHPTSILLPSLLPTIPNPTLRGYPALDSHFSPQFVIELGMLRWSGRRSRRGFERR